MAKNVEKPMTQPYILRAGQEHHGFKDGERHLFKGGDEVELSDKQYKAFKDKFDSKAELAARARIANGGAVSKEEALAALGLSEEQYNAIAPVEETVKKPDPSAGAGEQQKAAGEGLDKEAEGKDPKAPDAPKPATTTQAAVKK